MMVHVLLCHGSLADHFWKFIFLLNLKDWVTCFFHTGASRLTWSCTYGFLIVYTQLTSKYTWIVDDFVLFIYCSYIITTYISRRVWRYQRGTQNP